MKDINKTICYCGLAGDQKKNMLYCVKCKRWLHEECVKCLDVPMLLGDRFYILICSVCNSGSECLARIELKWSDVTHLVLYNLSVIHNKTYFDLDASIVPFVIENWQRFHLFGPISTVKSEEMRSKVLDVLLNDGRFKSGREVKKSKNIFGLRERIPPEPPMVQPSAAKVKKDVLIWEFHVKERPYRFLTSTKPKKNKDSTKNVKLKKKLPVHSRSKQNEVPKCSADPLHQENSVQKAKNRIKKSTVATFAEKSACIGLLDSLIPIPPDFAEENNPFLKSREKRAAKRSSCKEAPPQPTKRKYNGQLAMQNGNHKHSNGRKEMAASSSQSDSEMFFDAKDYFSDDSPRAKRGGICVMGKRVARTGKIQYLFQRNRITVEKPPSQAGPVFKMTFRPCCSKCSIPNNI